MRLLRRLLCSAGVLLALLILAISLYWHSGSSAVESWVGSQLLRIGATYLEPELTFDRLTYQRPRTILLDNLALTSPDPADPQKKVVILAVKRARLELTEIPRRGQPVKLSEVILESPEFRGIAGPDGLIGFTHMLKGSKKTSAAEPPAATVAAPPPAPAAPTAAAPAEGRMKLSDWLLIRHLQIKDGSISFDPRKTDTPPIWLDGINAHLDFTPVNAAGHYKLATTLSRPPEFDLAIDGTLNVDTLEADLAKLELTLDLQEKNAHYLPPDLQRILKAHEVSGLLRASASGQMPLLKFSRSTLNASLDITAARFAAGDNGITIDSWNFQADMRDGIVSLRKADAKLLGGELRLAGTIPLQTSQPARLSLTASDLKIQQLLRSLKPGEQPRYAGSVGADINFAAPLSGIATRSAGGGTFALRQGRISNIPLLGPILSLLNKSLTKALGIENRTLTDRAEGTVSFAGDRLRIDRLGATSGAMALRGNGTLAFNGTLDLRVNAGPLEMIQNSLGPIGNIWGTVSDALVGYRIHGTLTHPKVSVEVGR
jgi:hypothetical protein